MESLIGFGEDFFVGRAFAGTVFFCGIGDDGPIVLRLLLNIIEVEIEGFPDSLFSLSARLIEHLYICLIICL